MSEEKTPQEKTPQNTLTDDDMVTSPKLSRRLLIAGAGAALITGALGAAPVFATEGNAGAGDMEEDDAEKEKEKTVEDDEAKDDKTESEGESD